MKRLPNFLAGLGVNLAFWFSLSSIVLTLILSQVIEREASSSLRAEIGQRLADLALQTTDKLDRGMYERFREVQLMADRSEIGDPAVSPAEKQKLLDRMQQTYRYYAWIGIANMDGRIVAASNGILQGADISKRPWYPNALRGVHIDDVHEAKLLARLLPADPSGEPVRFVDVAFPFLKPDHSVGGVLAAHLSWSWARTIEQSVISASARSRRIDAMIVGGDGTVLLGPPGLQGSRLDQTAFKNAQHGEGKFVVQTLSDHKPYLIGYSVSSGFEAFPGFGWTVLVRQDLEEAFLPVRQIQRRVLWSGFSIALVFSLLGVLNARRISRPLVSLSRAATRLRRGEAISLGKFTDSFREVDALADSFGALVTDLQSNQKELTELNASLEQRVVQRTEDLLRSELRLRTITDNLPVLISYIDRDHRMMFCNGTFRDWAGIDPEKVIGKLVLDIIGAELYQQRRQNMERALAGERVVFDMVSTAMGVTRHLYTTYIPDRRKDGKVIGFYTLSTDVSAMKEVEQKLTLLARHDSLTGLPNRGQLNEKLGESIKRSRRQNHPLGVLFLDIDYFKKINDTFGHAAGDIVLKEFGLRLQNVVRDTDTVARLAGDEFIVLLEGLHNSAEAAAVAQKIVNAVAEKIFTGVHALSVTTSIGIAFSTSCELTAKEFLAQADRALYAAKSEGRNRFSLIMVDQESALSARSTEGHVRTPQIPAAAQGD